MKEKIKRFIVKNLKWIILFICLIGFLALAEDVFNKEIMNGDIILQRPRPEEFRIINESGYSFPSGHSMISMAFYGYLIYLIYKYVKNKYLKWFLITILGILIVNIGISRIYLGVHYTSDVLAGFLISISYLIVYISIVNKLEV